MVFKSLKKFSGTKQEQMLTEEVATVVLPGQMSMDDYMRQSFGCNAVSAEDLPSDEATLSIIFDYDETGVQ